MDGVLLNGAATPLPENQPEPPTALDAARARYMEVLRVRCETDQGPLHPVALRITLDTNESLIEGLFDLLVAKGIVTANEREAAQTKRLHTLADIIADSTRAAIASKKRVEVARTLPPGMG